MLLCKVKVQTVFLGAEKNLAPSNDVILVLTQLFVKVSRPGDSELSNFFGLRVNLPPITIPYSNHSK